MLLGHAPYKLATPVQALDPRVRKYLTMIIKLLIKGY